MVGNNNSRSEADSLLNDLRNEVQNPLEGLGLSEGLVRQLSSDSLTIVVQGLVHALQKVNHPDVNSQVNHQVAAKELARIRSLHERFKKDPIRVRESFLASRSQAPKASVPIREPKLDHTHIHDMAEKFDQVYRPDSVFNIRHALLLTKPSENVPGNIVGLPWFSIESGDMHSSLVPYRVSRSTIASDEGFPEMIGSIKLPIRQADKKAIFIKDGTAQIIATEDGTSTQYQGEYDSDFKNNAWYLTRGSNPNISFREIAPKTGSKPYDIQLLGTIDPEVALPLSPRAETKTIDNKSNDDTIYALGEETITSSSSLPQWVRSRAIPNSFWVDVLNSTGESDKAKFRPTLEVGRILLANILDFDVRVALGEICAQDVEYFA